MHLSEQKKEKGFQLRSVIEKVVHKSVVTRLQESRDAVKHLDSVLEDFHCTVGNLDTKIDEVINKRSQRMQHAHEIEIKAKQKILNEAKAKYEDHIFNMTKDGQIKKLENELIYYREQALKSSKTLEAKDAEIKILKNKVITLQNEKGFLDEYTKVVSRKAVSLKLEQCQNISENIPKVPNTRPASCQDVRRINVRRKTLSDMSKNNDGQRIRTTESHSFDVSKAKVKNSKSPQTLEAFLKSLEAKSFEDKNLIIQEITTFYREIMNSYEQTISANKKEISKEKTYIEHLFNSKQEKTKNLAEFFSGCVDDVKRNICKRRVSLKANFSKTVNQTFVWPNKNNDFNDIKYSDFSLSDKHKVLELFVSHNAIVDSVKHLLLSFNNQGKNENASTLTEPHSKSFHNKSVDLSDLLNVLDNEHNLDSTTSSFSLDYQTIPARPKTVNSTGLDLSNLPKITELDGEILATGGTTANSRNISTKFAQLNDSDHVPAFHPKGNKLLRNVAQAYKS